MTAGNGKPCKKCGTSAWYKDGNCIKCRQLHRAAHSDKERERVRRWRLLNPDKAREQIYRWRGANPEKARDFVRRWQVANPSKVKAANRRWQVANPDKMRVNGHRRRAKKQSNGGSFTPAEWKALCDQYGNRCLCCGRDDRGLTVDHVVPVSKGGSGDIGNIQPLCGPCNSSKGDKSTDYRTKPQAERWTQPKLF